MTTAITRIPGKISYSARTIGKCSMKIFRDITGKNSGIFKPNNRLGEEDLHRQSRYSKIHEMDENVQVPAENYSETDGLSTNMKIPNYIVQRALRIRDRHIRARSEAESEEIVERDKNQTGLEQQQNFLISEDSVYAEVLRRCAYSYLVDSEQLIVFVV